MTIFELVRLALDELYEEGKAEHGTSLDKVTQERMKYLSENYNQPNDPNRSLIEYKDPATRFAYAYKNVAAHGDYLVQIMERIRSKQGNIFTGESVRVSCVGGGPGSDIVGVLKYLDNHKGEEPVKKVTCYLLDKEQAWADTWTEVGESLNACVTLNANFQQLDVTCAESWKVQRKFLTADIFTMSYFVSEIFCLRQAVTEFWKELFEHAKPGALFLYDDNGHADFSNYFHAQCHAAGLQRLLSADEITLTPSWSEQASELGMYLEKFGQQPKLKSLLAIGYSERG